MASKGLRAISAQADKLPERKDAHRKPLLPHLRVAEVVASGYSDLKSTNS